MIPFLEKKFYYMKESLGILPVTESWKASEFPIYDVVFDEDAMGITAVSLVDRPAIETDFIKFKEQEPVKLYLNEEQRMIVGPALIPDKLIYRVMNGREFFIRFSKETITDLAFQFFERGWLNNVTIMHEEGETPFSCLQEGVECTNCWIETEDYTEAREYGFDLPEGTWMLGYHVIDDSIWEQIKKRELRGFSIEAFLDLKMSNGDL